MKAVLRPDLGVMPQPAPVASELSGRTYDIVVEVGGRDHWLRHIPIEWPIEMLLAGAFPGVAVRHIGDEDGENSTLQ